MSVTKEENGTWTAQFWCTDADGRKRHKKRRGFKTKREAREWELSMQETIGPANMLLKDFVNVYYEDKKNELKDRTLYIKKLMVATYILPVFGEKRMSEIGPADIIKWQNNMMEKGLSETYLRMIQNQLTALFTHASRIYDLKNNPCKKVKRMGRSDAKDLNFWTKEEYDRFIQHCEPGSQYFTVFELLFWTGMREGEMLALTKEDVDLANKRIRINKTYYRKDGKDIITAPKTEQSVRIIDIPDFLAEELEEYMSHIYGLKDQDRLFPVVQEAVQHALRRRIKKYGLKKIRVHDFRHSHCAYLIHQGVEPLVIKERLGHADIRITLNTYGHLYPSRQKEIAKMLDQKKKEKKGEGPV